MRYIFLTLIIVIYTACKSPISEQIISRYSNGQVKEKYIFNKNDSLTYQYEFYSLSGQLRVKGNYHDFNKVGIWEEYDSAMHLTGVGKYASELTYDTLERVESDPPYSSYDTVFRYQHKDSIWSYFDVNNKLVKLEKYSNGRLIK